MPFTYADAVEMIGDSTDWPIGLRASIMKWEQRTAGDMESYPQSADCGLCIVSDNRDESCAECPIGYLWLCRNMHLNTDPEEVLRQLQTIELEEE